MRWEELQRKISETCAEVEGLAALERENLDPEAVLQILKEELTEQQYNELLLEVGAILVAAWGDKQGLL